MRLYKNNKEILLYIFFGGMTTIVNFVIYFIFSKIFGVYYLVSNVIAWGGAVIFAYLTNKVWVFESKERGSWQIMKEFILFVGCRVLSGVGETGILFVCVNLLNFGELIGKILASIFVVISNYVFSKLIIFKKK